MCSLYEKAPAPRLELFLFQQDFQNLQRLFTDHTMSAYLSDHLAETSVLDQLKNLSGLVGDTPLISLDRLHSNPGVKILAKAEWMQMGGSVKARPAFNIIAEAILSGKLRKNMRLLDASSGNTAIAYTTFANALGIGVTLCIPENASEARITMLKALGAEVVFSSRFESTEGAQTLAKELHSQAPELYFYADQYSNDHNWRAHYKFTGMEINQQTRGKVTHFVTGLGTTGTFTGTGRRLKDLNPSTELIALQPETALHGLEGWKHLETADVPKIFDSSLADRTLEVGTEEAYRVLKATAKLEGLLLSPSSAANVAGALKIAEEIDEGVIVTILPDDASKYMEILNRIIS